MSQVSTFYKGDCLFESVMGNHRISIDMPESMGGKDRGPMPPQLFAASLSSCVGVLVTDFCHKHGLDPAGLEVHASYDMAKRPLRVSHIQVRVELPNVACDDVCLQKAIAHVAEHCPVRETVESAENIGLSINFGQNGL